MLRIFFRSIDLIVKGFSCGGLFYCGLSKQGAQGYQKPHLSLRILDLPIPPELFSLFFIAKPSKLPS
jgi:hypothetical protein